jgi:Uncharacterized conserved protein
MNVTAKKLKTVDMMYVAMFAALISVCAWIAVPATVSFTMQTFGVFSALFILGGKRGFLAILVYVLLGVAGLPVFSGFSGGFGIIAGATGGYIVGFLICALAYWLLTTFWKNDKKCRSQRNNRTNIMLSFWHALVRVHLRQGRREEFFSSFDALRISVYRARRGEASFGTAVEQTAQKVRIRLIEHRVAFLILFGNFS